jgi:CheY-like chemotaxis protein
MKRVFVIDDDSLMRELIVRRLASHNYDTTAFADAADALDPLVVERPDLVLTDFRMPRMNGIELIRRVRAQGIGVPVIMITAEPSGDLIDQAHAVGIRHVFRKPLGENAPVWSAIERELARSAPEPLDELDGLRLELLTDLSHQLRTPLTATKLALEGLLQQIDGSLDESQRRLAAISCRNVDRLVRLIERQLETLQARVRQGQEEGTSEDGAGGGGGLVGAAIPGRRSRP